MSRTYKDSRKFNGEPRPRRISVRAVLRDSPDLHHLSRALIQMVLEQAALEAAAQAQTTSLNRKKASGE